MTADQARPLDADLSRAARLRTASTVATIDLRVDALHAALLEPGLAAQRTGRAAVTDLANNAGPIALPAVVAVEAQVCTPTVADRQPCGAAHRTVLGEAEFADAADRATFTAVEAVKKGVRAAATAVAQDGLAGELTGADAIADQTWPTGRPAAATVLPVNPWIDAATRALDEPRLAAQVTAACAITQEARLTRAVAGPTVVLVIAHIDAVPSTRNQAAGTCRHASPFETDQPRCAALDGVAA